MQMHASYKKNIYKDLVTPLLFETLSILENKKKSYSLLDLGCGHGSVLFSLKLLGFLKKAIITGIDKDKKALKTFKENFPHATVLSADISIRTSIKSNSFDVAICNQVVEHIDDDDFFVSEIYRILKKQGHIYIGSVLKKWYGLYWHRNIYGKIVVDPDHKREYRSVKEFENLLIKNGFLIKKLAIIPGRLPLGDYFFLLLFKVGLIQFSDMRSFYFSHPKIYNTAKKIQLPLPGYAIIEAIAQKK